ncbi:MAG: TetR/AcrR family transcriptional regulator [Bacteroidia bacterium]|nr:TetR/AcrR family transcriptional regulator [Bacteroidia bacterium]
MEKKAFYIKESLKLFMKFGVKSVTVGQITAKLNISSKTLYLIFGDKTALVEACFDLYKENSAKEFDFLRSDSDNVADMLVRFYNTLIESISRINPNFFNDIASYFPKIWDSDEAFGINQTRELMKQGISEGIFSKAIDVELCAETLTLLLRSMFEKDPYDSRHGGSQRLLANVLWPYIRGLCTPEGMEEFRKYRKFVAHS